MNTEEKQAIINRAVKLDLIAGRQAKKYELTKEVWRLNLIEKRLIEARDLYRAVGYMGSVSDCDKALAELVALRQDICKPLANLEGAKGLP